MRTALAALVFLCAAQPADAHIALNFPATRSVAQKAGPCGSAGSTRGANVTTFQPGETITMTWTETVDHPGHYRIAFDDDGQDVFRDPSMPTDNFAFTLVDQIADKSGGMYSAQVTLPTTPCDNCTLQLMQVMTTSVPYNSFYWQCADIVIAGDVPDPDPDPDVTEGGCSTGTGSGAGAIMVIGLLAVRRRRRR